MNLGKLAVVLVLCGCVSAAAAGSGMIDRIRMLSDRQMLGRDSGSSQALACADSIAAWMAEAGLIPAPGRDTYHQDFMLTDDEHAGMTGRNVLGWRPGRGELSGSMVVVGAHYDHLGGRDDGTGFYPGAEDNASGVAVMLSLAESLDLPDDVACRSCLFIAFSGEEIGLQGSRAFVETSTVDLAGIEVMLNLDSVGRLRDDRLYVGGLGSAAGLRDIVVDSNAGHGLDLELSDSGWDASDHVSFNAAGIPVLFLFTGPHPQYHSEKDTWDLIPAGGLSRVRDYARDLVAGLMCRENDLTYRSDGTLPQRPTGDRKTRAWLGTIPDFADSVEGVELSGVMPDSPAEEIGLQAGDVIIAIGKREIRNLGDLTVALQDHVAGQMTRVRFRRGGEERTVPVTLRKRPD